MNRTGAANDYMIAGSKGMNRKRPRIGNSRRKRFIVAIETTGHRGTVSVASVRGLDRNVRVADAPTKVPCNLNDFIA